MNHDIRKSYVTKMFLFHLLGLDINECAEGSHECQHICNNTPGSFHCSCFDGYQLNNDSTTCSGQLRKQNLNPTKNLNDVLSFQMWMSVSLECMSVINTVIMA